MKSRAAVDQRHMNVFRAAPIFPGFLGDFTERLQIIHCTGFKLLMDRTPFPQRSDGCE